MYLNHNKKLFIKKITQISKYGYVKYIIIFNIILRAVIL